MNLQLENKLALVTGSTKGIGLAIATSLAREGARVIVNGRAEKSVNEAVEKIRKSVPAAKLEMFAGDLAKADGADSLVKQFPNARLFCGGRIGISLSWLSLSFTAMRLRRLISTPVGS